MLPFPHLLTICGAALFLPHFLPQRTFLAFFPSLVLVDASSGGGPLQLTWRTRGTTSETSLPLSTEQKREHEVMVVRREKSIVWHFSSLFERAGQYIKANPSKPCPPPQPFFSQAKNKKIASSLYEARRIGKMHARPIVHVHLLAFICAHQSKSMGKVIQLP